MRLIGEAEGGAVIAPAGDGRFTVLPNEPGGTVTFHYAATDAASGYSSTLMVVADGALGVAVSDGVFSALGVTVGFTQVQDDVRLDNPDPTDCKVTFTGSDAAVDQANEWFAQMYAAAPRAVRQHLLDIGDEGGVTIDWLLLWEITEQHLKARQNPNVPLPHLKAHGQTSKILNVLYRSAYGPKTGFHRPTDSTSVRSTRAGVPIGATTERYHVFGFNYNRVAGRRVEDEILGFIILDEDGNVVDVTRDRPVPDGGGS